MFKKKYFLFFALFAVLLIAAGCGNDNAGEKKGNSDNNNAASESGLPKQMTWSVYDVGSGGYAEMSAIANSLTDEYGTQVRMLPSASGVGRMIPLRDGKASIGKLGDEIQFSFEAIEEFASPEWGPQNVQGYWAPISPFGLGVKEKSDIKSIEDLKGKKVPFISGNSSINIKTEAMLAFAGLTWDDVKVVELTSYAGQGEALVQGQIDVASINPAASSMFEADSKGGVRWLEMDPDDKEGWKRVEHVASWFFPRTIDDGAGMDKDTNIMGHAYLIGGYADQDPDTVYELIKAFNDTFDKYKDATSTLYLYSKDEVLTEPRGVPFHEGAIKFFKENNMWDDEKQAKNDELVERQKKLQEAWDQAVKEAKDEGISDKDFPAFWLEKKAELVK
ncbi:TAXI family TRAP transporter solute-binding subunit [Pueribacillus theae]|uniref:TAXI family TRAP transporter solute-binding subunit n=1 Tax=Pueribacillus theae TaxID=2171751 RepID=UPI0014021051|nr:TAXI family TRAP transporter solute-binding subunit [Pueribacillus theae]